MSGLLHDIVKAKHPYFCKDYYIKYLSDFGQEHPNCEYGYYPEKIQKLIRKVHIDENGSVTKIQFDNKKNVNENWVNCILS